MLTCAAALFADCGDDSSDSGSGTATEGKQISRAKVIDPGSMNGAKGDIAFCTGEDTSGSKTAGVEAFSKANPDINVKLIEFESGRATVMRNWPYCYALAQKADATKGKFAAAPLPEVKGGGKAGILGGANLVISTYSTNPGAALKFIDYTAHDERQAEDVTKFSDASPLKSIYEDPAVQKAQPFSDELKTAIEQAKSRPVSPVYPPIYKNVNQALSGAMSPEDALKNAQTEIEQALKAF